MKSLSKTMYIPKENEKEIAFMLYNYDKIDELIEDRKDELIDKIKVTNEAYLKSINKPCNTLEDTIIKISEDRKIYKLELWKKIINKFMSELYDEEDRFYYSLIRYKYFHKLSEDIIREKMNLSKDEFREIDIFLKWNIYNRAIKEEIFTEEVKYNAEM